MKEIILTASQVKLLKESIKEKLAAARKDVNTAPTEKQCKAGNYAMGHISISGFQITIENPKGSYRCGKDKNGKEWKTLMHNDYGYFTKTVGKDGDEIDVFLGPYLDDKIEDAKIYPIDQYLDGKFDETKIMMGFRDKESAKAAYLSNYDKDWKGFKYISEVDIPTFKKWLYDGYRQRKPFAKYITLSESLNSIVKNGEEKKLRDTVKAMVKDLETLHSIKESELKTLISESIQKVLKESSHAKKINMDVELRKGGRNAVKMTEKQVRKIKSAMTQVHNKVNAGIMDGVCAGGMVCEENGIEKWTMYRGYDKTLGSQKTYLLWLTDDLGYAKEYGNAIDEYIIDAKKVNNSIYAIDEYEPYFDYIEGPSKEAVLEAMKNGVGGYIFYANNEESFCVCLWDKSAILSQRTLSQEEYDAIGSDEAVEKHMLEETVKSMVKNDVERKLRDTVKRMVKDGSLPTDYSLEMAEWYYNIIAKALNIDRGDVSQTISEDDRYYFSIIDDEFEKCGGKYDLMDCENHRKGMKKNLEKLHNIKEDKLTEIVSKSIRKILKEGTHAKKINMNVELRKGGRNAVKMSEKQFEEVLKAAWEQYYIDAKPEKYYLINKWSVGGFVYKCCYNSPKRNKDSKILSALYDDIWCTKYKFDTENVECLGKIRMSNKGVPYLVCYAGGDWECPVCFIVYYDGNKIRAYIPLKGNAINRNTHQAFGNSGEEDEDVKFITKELNIDKEEAKKYINNIDFDTNACVEDFLSRIEVKGTYKEKDFTKIHDEYKELESRLKKQDEEENAKKEAENDNEITESKNDEGNEIPKKCDKCGGEINLQIHGEPVYLCSKCGKYFGTMPFNVNESMINEKFNSPKLTQLAKEHGGIEISHNGGVRNGANAWQQGHAIDLSKVTDDMIIGEPFTPERWAEEPNAICFNDGTIVRLKTYEELPAPNKKEKISKYGTGIGDTGDHDKHIGGFKTQKSISQQSAPYNGYATSNKAGVAQGYRTALKNNHDVVDYFKNHPEREDGYKQSREAQNTINKLHGDIKNDIRLQHVNEGKKRNLPKNEVAAINKSNREEDIKSHGKSTAFRTTIENNPKAYTRKEKHKKVYMTEEQFKGYCRVLLEEKRKKDYVTNILKESKWYDFERDEDYTPYPEDLGGKFEIYLPDTYEPITGVYSFHIKEEPRTYDYPGSSECIFDDIDFNTPVSDEIKQQIKDIIQNEIDKGGEGDIYLEL